eukprot:4377964-Pyramimonas_sp.AAC.1
MVFDNISPNGCLVNELRQVLLRRCIAHLQQNLHYVGQLTTHARQCDSSGALGPPLLPPQLRQDTLPRQRKRGSVPARCNPRLLHPCDEIKQ